MADDRIIRSIVEKCKFFYDDALLSDETIIEKYLSFFARQFDPAERSVSFAFHTGSLCLHGLLRPPSRSKRPVQSLDRQINNWYHNLAFRQRAV